MKPTKIDINAAQYYMRQAFEEGFRAAGGNRGQSVISPERGKWFDSWVVSKTRATLVSNGAIDGTEGYK